MSYTHILVAVAITPESQQLLAKAVSIAQPVKGRISLVTLAADPEMYNHLAAQCWKIYVTSCRKKHKTFLIN